MKRAIFTGGMALLLGATCALAADRTVALQGHNDQNLGSAAISYSTAGTEILLQVKALSEGWHRVALHERGDCAQLTNAGNALPLRLERQDDQYGADEKAAGGDDGIIVARNGDGAARFFVPGLVETTLNDDDGTAIVVSFAGDQGALTPVACGVIAPAQP